MSEEENGFDSLLRKRIPPKPQDMKGATGKRAVKPRTRRTEKVQIRTDLETRIAIKQTAALQNITISELLENAFFEHTGKKPDPEVIYVPAKEPEPDPRDAARGYTRPLELWGNQDTEQALKMLADHINVTPSELLEILLVARVKEYKDKGIQIKGLNVK